MAFDAPVTTPTRRYPQKRRQTRDRLMRLVFSSTHHRERAQRRGVKDSIWKRRRVLGAMRLQEVCLGPS